MIKKYYGIYDLTAKNYLNPLEAKNHADAIRLFTTFVNGDKEQSNIARYPHQFILYHMFDMDDVLGTVGTFNDKTSELESQTTPTELIIGSACLEEERHTYTVKDLITRLKLELGNDNIIDITDSHTGAATK